jgi:hypothetical protein
MLTDALSKQPFFAQTYFIFYFSIFLNIFGCHDKHIFKFYFLAVFLI